MNKRNFEFNEKFFNFMYYALLEKLYKSTEQSEYFDHNKVIDERVPIVLGDFFEQVLGIEREEALKRSEKRMGRYLNPEYDLSDPVIADMLYNFELLKICGSDEIEFDELYLPLNLNQ